MAIIPTRFMLLIIGHGDSARVRVPGYEPLTEQTTKPLSVAFQGKESYINVKRALKLIPGSYVLLSTLNMGTFGSESFLVLPVGPKDGNACYGVVDYYKILQEAATLSEEIYHPHNGDEFDDFNNRREFEEFYRDVNGREEHGGH